jgi:hypothetical protein
MPYINRPRPLSELDDGKFSIQYAVASVLLDRAGHDLLQRSPVSLIPAR